jgi:hypothetical protein
LRGFLCQPLRRISRVTVERARFNTDAIEDDCAQLATPPRSLPAPSHPDAGTLSPYATFSLFRKCCTWSLNPPCPISRDRFLIEKCGKHADPSRELFIASASYGQTKSASTNWRVFRVACGVSQQRFDIVELQPVFGGYLLGCATEFRRLRRRCG